MRVLVLIALFLALVVSPVVASAACDPPLPVGPGGAAFPSLIGSKLNCSDITAVTNYSVLINGSGELILTNSALQFNSTTDGECGLENDGILVIEQGSVIENITNYSYTFVSNVGASLEIRDSFIHGCGYSSSDNKEKGLYIKSDGTSIRNTTFTGNYMGLMIYSDDNLVDGNNISSNQRGVHIEGSGNIIKSNIMEDFIGGFYVRGENLKIKHNLIKNTSAVLYSPMSVNDSVIRNNTFRNNSGGVYGFEFAGNNNNITFNTILSNDYKSGLGVYDAGDTRIVNNTILYNNGYGLALVRTINALVDDNLCGESEEYDLYMESAGDTLLNNTDYTTLIKKWSLDVAVVNTTGDPIRTAYVVIKDASSKTVFSANTNSDGTVAQRFLEEVIENGSGTFDFNPYSVNVSKAGYIGSYTEFNLTGNLAVEVELSMKQQTGGFTFDVISPLNDTYLEPDIIVSDGMLEIEVSNENISSCDYSVENATEQIATGQITETDNWFYDYLDVTGMEGPYKMIIECISVDGITNSSIVFFTLYPDYECVGSDDCMGTETCIDYVCEVLECVCGYAANHECLLYDCCEDSDCVDEDECNLSTHACTPVICPCSEKIYDHECNMGPGYPEYCCSGHQCNEEEECISHECVERKLIFSIPENLAVGQTITIQIMDQDGDPVYDVGIEVDYPDTDQPVETETFYTDSSGYAEIPIRHAGRVVLKARKAKYYTSSMTGEVPEPLNMFFIIQVIILIVAVAGIFIIVLKYMKGGGLSGISFRKSPLKLDKTISGERVMLMIKNTKNERIEGITIRDSVPKGSFMRARIVPKVEKLDGTTDILTWEILKLEANEEVDIEYETRSANKGFSVQYKGKEYKA